MARYHVTPLPDDSTARGSWQVKRNGRLVSNHIKKSSAKRQATKLASDGDTIVTHNSLGVILSERTKGRPGPAGDGR